MNLKPVGDKVILKPVATEEKTQSGIVLTQNNNNTPQQAKVIAVGDGNLGNEKVDMFLSVDDVVVYPKHLVTEVELQGEKYLVIKQNEILAIIN